MPLDVVYADDHLLVLNKPSGLLAVPGKTSSECLSLQVQAHYADALVVHRLDMATSGLMVMARGIAMQRLLNASFSERKVHKRYIAIVAGDCRGGAHASQDGEAQCESQQEVGSRTSQEDIAHAVSREGSGLCAGKGGGRAAAGGHGAEPTALPAPPHEVNSSQATTTMEPQNWHTIALPIIVDWPRRPLRKICHQTGKPSTTRWRCTAYNPERNTSRLELEPLTGRSHQLRVHLQALGHPIVGDSLYAPPELAAASPRLLLHAAELAFTHPASGTWVSFHSPDPFGAWA